MRKQQGFPSPWCRKPSRTAASCRLVSLLKFAHALNTDVSVILGQQAPRRGMDQGDRAALRQLSDAVHESALGEWEGIDDPSAVEDLSEARDRAWAAYWASDTAKVSSYAAKVLMEGQVRYASATGSEREQLGSILASTYRVAASCSNGFGQRDLALSALTSAKHPARDVDDPVMTAPLESTLSWIYLRGASAAAGRLRGRAGGAGDRAVVQQRVTPPVARVRAPDDLCGRGSVAREDESAADDYYVAGPRCGSKARRDEKLYGTSCRPNGGEDRGSWNPCRAEELRARAEACQPPLI